MLVTHIVGARPNFMKAAPVLAALDAAGVQQRLVHTGQHYDENMSDVFFRQLELPEPDVNLEVGSGSHAVQTAETMTRLEAYFEAERPDLLLVYGDVNSTVAASLVCAKMGIRVGHVEAGLRSYDRAMPEEVNRMVTDRLADLLFTPSVDGNENLAREGADPEAVHFVGNVMIDTLVRLLPKAEARWDDGLADELGVRSGGYGLVTLHRPSNVDEPDQLRGLVDALDDIAADLPLVFPVHPRTRARMAELGLAFAGDVRLLDPVGYLDFLALQRHARLVLTDSGGVQEETTYLGVPCLTARENTERPVTVTMGTNRLVGRDLDLLRREARAILAGEGDCMPERPPLWDGRAGERIAAIVAAGVPEPAPA